MFSCIDIGESENGKSSSNAEAKQFTHYIPLLNDAPRNEDA